MSWQLAVGSWQLAVGSWQLAVGSWQLAVGSWQLAVQIDSRVNNESESQALRSGFFEASRNSPYSATPVTPEF